MTFAQETSSHELPMSVPSFLRSMRDEHGLTQKELSDRSGISVSAIKQYERESGGTMPTIEKAAILAQILEFDPRDLFDEALGKSRHPKAADPTHAEGTRHDNRGVEGDLDRLQKLVADRGLNARLLPGMVSQVRNALGDMSYRDLLSLAEGIGIDLAVLPSEEAVQELGDDARGEVCVDLESRIIVNSLYGDKFESLSLDDLRKLHRVTARALDKEPPLRGVPMRSFVFDIIPDAEDDKRMQKQILYALPKHLVEAVVRGRAVVFRLFDPDFDEGSERFEVTKKLQS